MKRMLIALALLFATSAGTAQAATIAEAIASTDVAASTLAAAVSDTNQDDPRKLPFLEGTESPTEIATLVEDYLKKHPAGDTPIIPAKCTQKVKLACASALNLLRSFQEIDPTAPLASVRDLPKYLRELKQVEVPNSGMYELFCVQQTASGSYREVSACVQRPLHKGEPGWVSPYNHQIVMAHKCKNPVNGPVVAEVVVKLNCRELHFIVPPKTNVFRYEWIGNRALKTLSACPLRIKVPGNPAKLQLSDDCASKNCTFREAEAWVTHKSGMQLTTRTARGSHAIVLSDQEQVVVLYGPPDVENIFAIACVDVMNPDGTPKYSNGVAVSGSYGPEGKLLLEQRFTFPTL